MTNWIDWSVVQGNKAVLTGQVTDINGNPLNLTGFTLQLIIKPTETSADNTGTTYVPTITTAALGKWSLTIAGSNFAAASKSWYRMDVVDGGGGIVTANLGNVSVMAA